ncbi:TPA: restriction endonuclease subunit S [Elizabethkingia anophelis]
MASKGDIDKYKIQPILFPNWVTYEFENTLQKTTITHKLKSKDYFEKGIYPVIDQGNNLISGYIDNHELLYSEELPVIIFGDHTRNIKFIDFEFAVGADGTKILKPHQNFNIKFYYYYLLALKVPDFGYSRHFSILKLLDVPCPPLPEQERIVAKLDTLFAQHESMKKALESIPQLLKDFRQQVLTQAATGKLIPFINSENIKLNDLGIWKGGGTPSKGNSSFWNNGTILWITPKDMKELFLSNSIDKITKLAVQNSSAILIPKNSILIVTRSGILRRILPISSNSVETTVNQDLKVLIPNNKINYKFLLYILKGLEENIRTTCMKSGTTVESIEFSLLKDYKINIPMLLVQQEIVEKIESLFSKANTIEKRYKTLKAKIDSLPQAILHKAFKGELVPQLPTDGDAKDLLEEILKLKKEVKKK